jgi:hypothetical protein
LAGGLGTPPADGQVLAGLRVRLVAACACDCAEPEQRECRATTAPADRPANGRDEELAAAREALRRAQQSAASLAAEREALRKDLEKARKEREEVFKWAVELTDKLHQNANDLTKLKARNIQLMQDLEKYKAILRDGEQLSRQLPGLQLPRRQLPTRELPRVEGKVVTVADAGLVEISIGSDSGLRQGDRLDVYRSEKGVTTYLSGIVLVEVVPDRAVGKIIPELRRGEIRKGDSVSTLLH